jgi:Zn-dependent metalloprotease
MAGSPTLASLDTETAAYRHLTQALATRVRRLKPPAAGAAPGEFKGIGSDTLPLTGTRAVRFRQFFDKIPVYGSLVTVEMDRNNECLAISAALARPARVSPLARVSPATAATKVERRAGYRRGSLTSTPRLYYYFDAKRRKWRLAYIVEDVTLGGKTKEDLNTRSRPIYDYVIDAHSGALVDLLPRTCGLAVARDTAKDGLGLMRTFECSTDRRRRKQLRNQTLGVVTFDFKFRDPTVDENKLPGRIVSNPPDWAPGAVSAHANIEDVCKFLRDVLKRNSIDNRGGTVVSSVNCVVEERSPDGKQWINAMWNGHQMVFGQREENGRMHSAAQSLDIVGHEVFHGVTSCTSRLEYRRESGALNESYSDIFGVLVSNWGKKTINEWNWVIADEFVPEGWRNLRRPGEHCNPKPSHMKDYENKPDDEDAGGVHTNSTIHSLAFCKIATSRGKDGGYLFTPRELAAMFYVALTQYLSRTSRFTESRQAVLLAAQTLFRHDAPATRKAKVEAVRKGFSAVGIK